jgi:predicted DNA-binding protein (MmcQ/YjbR family)
MDASWIRELCLSFPSVTEHVIWGNDLTFKVAGKMFAHAVLEPAPVWLSFKASPENFYELTERPGIIPAPYLARAQWVALETKDALSFRELSEFVRDSYDLIVAKLPKKTRESLSKPRRT